MSVISWRQVGWEQVGWKEVVWRDSNETGGYPGDLSLLWPSKLTDAGVLKSAKGPAPTFTDVPEVTSAGVTPGDGPAFTSVVTWTAGGTRMVRFTADTASADITDDVEIGGGFWATSNGLEFRDGTNVASVATVWESGEVVDCVVQVSGGFFRVGDGSFFGNWVALTVFPIVLAFAATAPGSLLRVEENTALLKGFSALVIDDESVTVDGQKFYMEAQ